MVVPGHQSGLFERGSFSPDPATFAHDVECYSLPYGAIGFISHLLTYGTLVSLWFYRRPLWPLKKLVYARVNLVLGILGLIACTATSIFTIFNCRNSWQLMAIGAWRLGMALLSGVLALHIAYRLWKRENGEGAPERSKAHYLILLYIPGLIAGFAALMSLVFIEFDTNGPLKRLTIVFFCVVGLGAFGIAIILISVLLDCDDDRGGGGRGNLPRLLLLMLEFSAATFVILAGLYADWALGILDSNLWGNPRKSGEKLYWVFFVGTHLALLST